MDETERLVDPRFLMRLWLWLAVPLLAWSAPEFDRDVRPILSANCDQCHSAKVHSSGFSIATRDSVLAGGSKYGAAIVPGDPAGSPLLKLLKGELAPRMPVGKTLDRAEI